ncbi:MAG: hypothetical protein JWO25_3130 [Alphaproteobacteria bacterium]|nr:hypothetical protein [Alphaproteobacteria bacterium]
MYPINAILTAAFASSGAPTQSAVANDAGTDDGGFDYRTEIGRAGIIAIEGLRVGDGSPFSLRFEHSGRVTGKVAGAAVRFWTSAAAHRRLCAKLAA